MKKSVVAESASKAIDEKINELGDWRGKMLARVRKIVHGAAPEIAEEWKWAKATSPGTPVWSRGGIVCTGETYKNIVKMTFAKGAALKDPIRAAVALNLQRKGQKKAKAKPKSRRTSSERPG